MNNNYEMKSFVRKLNGENAFKVESDLNKERLQELTATRDKLNAEIDELSRDTLTGSKTRFIENELSAYGLPATASRFITGDTPEDIQTSVKKFASICNNQPTRPTLIATPSDDYARRERERAHEQEIKRNWRDLDESLFPTWS